MLLRSLLCWALIKLSYTVHICSVFAGLASVSHKKKAKFWRAMLAQFPRLIDYLSADEDLKQVGLRMYAYLRVCDMCALMGARVKV